MSLLGSLKKYGAWTLNTSERLSNEELATIKDAKVVTSEWGLSVKITYKNGNISFAPLDSRSSLSLDDTVDMSKGALQEYIKGDESCIKFLED